MRLNNPIGRVYQPVSAELAGKEDMAFNPVHADLFGVNAAELHAQFITHLVKQFWGVWRGAFIGKIRVCHNFTSFKNGALQIAVQIICLEGAFAGVF
ncbi:MAG: hypothetical protein AWT59_0594 [Candidatus Gallionella acididurans]|uniref:Uncharacterized protein n=1 Tax=Candidatus Gallionella acididurans TaxID=1796491 RepID=A0A139BWC7_9PROT|nr:MAG: hypothetical protein AWT59_0594 [Candidatus Gallionella acididurans]